MSKLVLGTAQFGLDYGISNASGKVPSEEARKILKLAKKNGIDTLDTAPGYGNSEKVLGSIGVNGFHIVTKTVPLKSGVDNVLQSFHQSLRDLNTTSVDGLLIHNLDDTKNKKFDVLFKELGKLKQDRLINKIGFSIYTPEQVLFLLENFDFDLIQVPFNVFDMRLIEGNHLQALKNNGVEVHARSVFLQGVLLNFNHLVNYFSRWSDEFQKYREIVNNNNSTLLEYALNYVLKVPEIDRVLIGVDDATQLVEIIDAIGINKNIEGFSIDDVNLLDPSLWKV